MVQRNIQYFSNTTLSLMFCRLSAIRNPATNLLTRPITQLQTHRLLIRSYSAKKSASSTRWLNRANNDIFSRKARELNMRSRAGFKLEEINKKFHIFSKNDKKKKISAKDFAINGKKGQNIVDLGFAPGAWSQVASKLSSPDSRILGVDILPCKPPEGVLLLQANILSRKTHDLIREFFVRNDEIMRNLRNRSEIKKKVIVDELKKNYLNVSDSEPVSSNSDVLKLSANSDLADSKTEVGQFENETSSDILADVSMENINESNYIDKNTEPLSTLTDKFVVDIVLSDMYEPFPQVTGFWNNTTNTAYYRMANTTGLKAKDHMLSMDLCEAGLILCLELLKPGGTYVCKFFSGKEDILLEHHLKRTFERVVRYKPGSSRSESTEAYFVCMGKRPNATIEKVYHHD